MTTFVRPTVLAAGLCLVGLVAGAQTAKAPKTQLWIDLSTGSMAGMPEMDMPMGGGLMGIGGALVPGGNDTVLLVLMPTALQTSGLSSSTNSRTVWASPVAST